MNSLGLIGGTGPESTIDYYRLLTAQYREKADGASPPVIINSVDLKRMIAWMGANELDKVTDYLVAEFAKLEKAGVDFAALTANTPHIVFDEVAPKSQIPLISIVEATCAAAKTRKLKRLALLGTRYTMQANFYGDVFVREEIELHVPSPHDQDYIHEKYFSELVPGKLLPETRAGLLAIVDRMKATSDIDGVILAGTELPLILRDVEHNGIPLLDTTAIHVEAAVTHILS